MNIVQIREKIPDDIFTTLDLKAHLHAYCNLNDKISSMMHSGEILQIRRGLYSFPSVLCREVISSGALANRIYGPSYVSADFALSYYGLIPETPTTVTSFTRGRTREFNTPFGNFTYRYCRSKAYSIGITTVGEGTHRFYIATPEKALFDKISLDSRFDGEDVEAYLYEDLRIDDELMKKFDKKIIAALAPFMRGRMNSLRKYLEAL